MKCDLTAPGEFEAVLNQVCPQVVIHAAAQRFPDQVEKDFDSARKLNVETSGRLATACSEFIKLTNLNFYLMYVEYII